MKYRKMGKNIKEEASALGFGAMRLPWKKFLFLKRFRIDEEEAIRMIRYAIDHGVNYIDTAYSYMGKKSEIVVGKALKDGYREKVKFLVTKLPMWKVKTREDFDKFLNEQLSKLDTDYLDIYLFHGLNKKRFELIKKLKLIEKMEQAKKEGKIRYFGFSFHDSLNVFKEIIDYYDWDVCQIQYNYMDAATNFQAETEGLKYAASKGIAVVIMEPLRGGKLANPPLEVRKIMDSSPIKRTPPDWALQFLWNKPEVSVVLSGMSTMQQVIENIQSAENSGINSLTAEELEILDKIANIYKKSIIIPCTKCNYCLEVCENGVAIPEIFDILNNYVANHDLKKAKKRFSKLVKEESKVDKENNNGAPDLCIKCRKCVAQCPQSIDIPEMLEKVSLAIEKGQSIDQIFK
ncbi:MAG: aldo/keto reductase [Promethearchaeota archaeon]